MLGGDDQQRMLDTQDSLYNITYQSSRLLIEEMADEHASTFHTKSVLVAAESSMPLRGKQASA